MSRFPNGFKSLTVRETPIEVPHPGKVFWVNNSSVLADGGVNGSNGNDGSYQRPFSTIDYAIGRCTANRGDVIYVMPGHSETISAAAGVDFDVAGISVIGLGSGTLQPRLDFTATGSTAEVNADNITIQNINFHANVSAVAIGLSVLTLATNLRVVDCTFDVETTTTDEFLIAINFGVGCNNFIVEDCVIDMGLGGAETGIKLVGATAGGTIRRNRIVGDYSLACIGGLTTASTEIYILDNLLIQGGSANVGAVAVISMVAASTGAVIGNYGFCNVATVVLAWVSTGMFFGQNYTGEVAGSAEEACLNSTATSVTAHADD